MFHNNHFMFSYVFVADLSKFEILQKLSKVHYTDTFFIFAVYIHIHLRAIASLHYCRKQDDKTNGIWSSWIILQLLNDYFIEIYVFRSLFFLHKFIVGFELKSFSCHLCILCDFCKPCNVMVMEPFNFLYVFMFELHKSFYRKYNSI